MSGQGKFERFASRYPVFRRDSFRTELFPTQSVASADSLLRYHAATGRVRHVAPGVYAVVPAHLNPTTFLPDKLAVATMIRPDGVVAYHSALEFHGLAYSETNEIQILSQGRPGIVRTAVGDVRFVLPPVVLRRGGDEMAGVETVDRRGLDLSVTGVERTLVDRLERPDYAGGTDELSHALWTVEFLRVPAFVDLVLARENRVLAALAGCWLDVRSTDFAVEPVHLDRLRERVPSSMAPSLGQGPGEGFPVPEWKIWVPRGLREPAFEDVGSGPAF